MSELLEAYIDSSDQVWKKVEASDGRTMRFKDGTPVTQNSYNGGKANKTADGQPTHLAVPSDKGGPGYERKRIDPKLATEIGRNLNLMRDDVPGDPEQTEFTIDGETYQLHELVGVNNRIIDRYGRDQLFRC